MTLRRDEPITTSETHLILIPRYNQVLHHDEMSCKHTAEPGAHNGMIQSLAICDLLLPIRILTDPIRPGLPD
jgi:hypothetical protein